MKNNTQMENYFILGALLHFCLTSFGIFFFKKIGTIQERVLWTLFKNGYDE